MTFETYAVSTYGFHREELEPESTGRKVITQYPVEKSPEWFTGDITNVYENIRRLGGRVVSHTVLELPIGFPDDTDDVRYVNHVGPSKPMDHAVIVAEIPDSAPSQTEESASGSTVARIYREIRGQD